MNENLIVFLIIIAYYIIGSIVIGLMHRFDPAVFDSEYAIPLVLGWLLFVPIYWFILFVDRCLYWFEKK